MSEATYHWYSFEIIDHMVLLCSTAKEDAPSGTRSCLRRWKQRSESIEQVCGAMKNLAIRFDVNKTTFV